MSKVFKQKKLLIDMNRTILEFLEGRKSKSPQIFLESAIEDLRIPIAC